MNTKKLKYLLIFFILNILISLSFSELNINYQFLEKEFYPNSYATLVIFLQNTAKNEIRSINLYLEPEDKNIEIKQSTFNLEKLLPSSQFSQNFLIKIGEDAKTSTIRVYISYYINSERKTYYLNIPIKIIRFPIILIKSINFSQDFLEPGKNISVFLDLYNRGYSSARDLKIKLLTPINFGIKNDEFYIREIKVSESSKIYFEIFSNPSIEVGYYNFQLLISYLNEDFSKIFNETKIFSIKVFGEPKLDIFLENFLDNSLTLKIVNIGISKAKNILIKINEKQFFVEELVPGDYDTLEIEKKDIIFINITYFDALNKKYEDTKFINLNEFIKTNISNITLPRKYPQIIPRQTQQNYLWNSYILLIFVTIIIILIITLFFIFKKIKRKRK